MQISLFEEELLQPPVAPVGDGFELLRAEAEVTGRRTQERTYEGEFWTARQRACHSLHEVSYRACFKPQLAAFFIERFSHPGQVVYDPFMGRGTSVLEAAFKSRVAMGSDLNPICARLIEPRLRPPCEIKVRERLERFQVDEAPIEHEELLAFYHPQTLREIESWRRTFAHRRQNEEFDSVDGWIEMVACSRLTGHSPGFFSVYTLPPNQAVSVLSQQKINARRDQTPPERDTRALIWRKTKQLLSDVSRPATLPHLVWTGCASNAAHIENQSVDLILTSPPFLNVVDYRADNWLRAWFLNVPLEKAPLWQTPRLEQWRAWMKSALCEWRRILRSSGTLVVEVGEINAGKLDLAEIVAALGTECGFEVEAILINSQRFTKTANCWGVDNMSKGTNSNRLVVFSLKP